MFDLHLDLNSRYKLGVVNGHRHVANCKCSETNKRGKIPSLSSDFEMDSLDFFKDG